MYLRKRTIIHLFGLLFLLALVPALAGCGGDPTETAPPDVETAPPPAEPVAVVGTPVVNVVTNPIDVEEVQPEEQVTISLEASGTNLTYEWHVERGTLSRSDGATAIYTAPTDAGPDSVDITISSDGLSTTRIVHFDIIAPEPTDVPTETVEPTKPVPIETTQPEETASAIPLTLTGLKNGQKVPCENPLEGTYSEDEVTGEIWPVVVIGGRWYPQEQGFEPALKAGGKWFSLARFGGCDNPTNDQGTTFQLLVIEADELCHEYINEFFQTAIATGDWSGIPVSEVPQYCLENVHVSIAVVRE